MHAITRLVVVVLIASVAGCATGYHRRAEKPVRELPRGYDVASLQKKDYAEDSVGQATPEELIALVEAALPRAEGQVIEHDPALDGVAAVVATTLAETEQLPAPNLTRWLMWHAGALGQLSGTFGFYGRAFGARQAFDEDLKKRAAAATLPKLGVRRFGVARVVVGGHAGQALIFADSVVELERVEKTASAGQTFELAGRFLVPADDVRLFIDDAPTKVRTLDVPVEDDGRFSISFPAPEAPGAHYLELGGIFGPELELPESKRWTRSAVLFPIYVDAPLPTQPDANIRAPAPNPPDMQTWPDEVLARYNAAREANGVAPLKLDKRLATIAQVYASRAGQGDRGSTDDFERDLAQAGLPVKRAQQIGTSFEYLEEDVWDAMRSPAMRAMLLDARLTHIGLGFAPDQAPSRFVGRALLVAPVGKLDPERERNALLGRLNTLLSKEGKRAVSHEETLTRLAQAWAERVCAGNVDVDDTSALQREVEGYARGRFTTYGLYRVGGAYVDPTDRRNYRDVMRREASHVGVGVCQGRVKGEDGVELVVFLTAVKR